ncbi:nuclear valosin-containing protein-like isoform X2 [Atheta coriaria]
MNFSRGTYNSDPHLIPRIQKYLENAENVDIYTMSDDLQKLYPKDYGRRKRNAFRSLVKKGFALITQTQGSENSDSSDLSQESHDEQLNSSNSTLHNQLLEMYGRRPQHANENEPIDISSDESEPPAKKSNGASSSDPNQIPIQLQVPRNFINHNNLKELSVTKINTDNTNRTPHSVSRKRKMSNFHANTPGAVTPAAPSSPAQVKHISRKQRGQPADLQMSTMTFKDIGGLEKVLENVCQLLVHIKHPEVYRQIGISPPRGFLLHGPPGCGKTLLANCIAGELQVPLLKVSAPELVAGVSGESEERIREMFERAVVASPCILFIDEIDAITPNRQFAQKDMERRIVAQLLTCMDDVGKTENGDQVLVIGATNRPDSLDPALRRAGRFDREVCLGIPDTKARLNILKVLTVNLRLDDDFDFETLAKYTPGFVGADLMALTREAAMVAVNRVFGEIKEKKRLENAIVEETARASKPAKKVEEVKACETEIIVDEGGDDLTPVVVKDKIEGDLENAVVVIDDEVAHKISAQGGGDAEVLPSNGEKPQTPETQEVEMKREPTQLEEMISWLHNDAPLNAAQLGALYITDMDFAKALKFVQPSAKREGFATVPDVTWDDVGSLRDIREELQLSILAPVRHAEQFNLLGLSTPTGVLLCGPPGCGKTLLAKAIANEAGINFISVKGPELLNMYVGESERAVRVCFERARNSAPCVIFFDELDALCPKRNDSREGGSTMRVVNQMLTEMDGVETRHGVYLLAASNRPDIIDPAVLRPGRLDKILYVGLPTAQDRVDILRTITKNGTRPLLADDVDLELIGTSAECEGYTGADLAALVREAAVRALREVILDGEIAHGKPVIITTEHFKHAVVKIRPSVSEKDRQHYAKLKKAYSARQPDVEEMEYS